YYTSIHIEELEIEARDTKLGPEEITRDIPNVGENMLRDLDESRMIRIGAQVKPGSILVGKVTPKGETQLTAEEKLLRAIFGEKAADVKGASLVSPPGIDGTVVDVQVFTRKGQEKDQRSMSIEEEEEERLRRDLEDEIRILHEQRNERIYELFEERKLAQDLTVNREVVIPKGVAITREMLQGIEPKALRKAEVAGSRVDAASEVKEYEDRTESTGRAVAHECGPDSRNASWLGRAGARFVFRNAGVRWRYRERNQAETRRGREPSSRTRTAPDRERVG